MADVIINVRDNGPLLVHGPIKLTDMQGGEFQLTEPTALCRCGRSTNAPFCTGAHKGQFESQPRAK